MGQIQLEMLQSLGPPWIRKLIEILNSQVRQWQLWSTDLVSLGSWSFSVWDHPSHSCIPSFTPSSLPKFLPQVKPFQIGESWILGYFLPQKPMICLKTQSISALQKGLLILKGRAVILTAPHFWLVQLSQHCFQAHSGQTFLAVQIPKYQTWACCIFRCCHDTPWCPVVLHQGANFNPSFSMCAGVSPGCCSPLWYTKIGQRCPASAPGDSLACIQTRWGEEPSRSVQGQKPSTGGFTAAHHHGRFWLLTALLHLPAAKYRCLVFISQI